MLNSGLDLYKKEWLDLVFSDRNKNYGAYDLRINSGQHHLRAMILTVGIFVVSGVMIKVFNKPQDQTKYSKPTVIDVYHYVEPPKEIKKEEVHVAKVHHAAAAKPIVHEPTQMLAVPKPTMETVKEDKFTPQTQIVNPGLTTSKGDGQEPKAIVDTDPGTNPNGNGNGTANAPSNEPVDAAGVDVMPEPVGGMAAWSKFLQRNIRYPDTDMEGRVLISFIIERDGKLSNITLARGVTAPLDEEALRVLKIAPAWKPGRQNGQAVRVKYTIPINFQMNQ